MPRHVVLLRRDPSLGLALRALLHGTGRVTELLTIQAWSPFQAGFFNGVFLGSADYPELNAVIDRLATQYDVQPISIATAWITRHPAQMQVVLGATTPERVSAAAQGSDIALSRAEWYELFRAAGHRVP